MLFWYFLNCPVNDTAETFLLEKKQAVQERATDLNNIHRVTLTET